jgi:4-hydroxybenzoate polyprenyltransferase
MTTDIGPHVTTGRPAWQTALYGHLALARISNSPTVASNVLTGAALGGAFLPDARIALLIAAMVLFYTAGMYLNDICDHQIDTRERPERPLPSGLVGRRTALALTIAMFALGLLLLVPFGAASVLSGLVLIGLIVAYDLWHKANPLSPLLMAGCRVLVYRTAFLAFAAVPTAALLGSSLLLGLYVVGLTLAAKYLRRLGPHIGTIIAGIALLDALLLLALGSTLGAGIAAGCFGLTLFLQRYVRGT